MSSIISTNMAPFCECEDNGYIRTTYVYMLFFDLYTYANRRLNFVVLDKI